MGANCTPAAGNVSFGTNRHTWGRPKPAGEPTRRPARRNGHEQHPSYPETRRLGPIGTRGAAPSPPASRPADQLAGMGTNSTPPTRKPVVWDQSAHPTARGQV